MMRTCQSQTYRLTDHSKQLPANRRARRSSGELCALQFLQDQDYRIQGLLFCTATKMKGQSRYLNSVAFFCLIFLHVLLEAHGAILTADQLLAQKVEELNRFVGVVEENSRNCDALNGCSADSCSRLSCYQYGTRGDPDYQCVGIQNNTACGSSCVQRNFDFTRSFLRRVDQIDERISRTVCTHRNLDDYFKTSSIADSSHFFRVFFGAVDGTFRIYPGADEDCLVPYDPRVRPWYIESTSVPKVVTVLVDSGLNMRSKLSGGTSDETYGSKAIATALRLLDTLQEGQDYVTLMSFDGAGTKALNATMIYDSALLYHSFSDRLTGNVNNGSKLSTNATASIDSINTAITELTSPSLNFPANYLKVVIVLTTGDQFQNSSQVTNISSSSGVNLFVYNFVTTAAQSCNPAIRASFEDIPVERLDNPLYALQSYYSFVANVHKSFLGDEVDYGQQYPDYSGVDNATLSLSKAAFGLSGDLLGVVGIDFFEEKVDEQYPTIQFQSIVDAARSHQPLTAFDTSTDLNTSVCFNHTDACPGLANTYVQGFLCQPKSNDKRIGCCGNCIPKKKILRLILGAVFGGVGGILVVFFIYWCCVRPRLAKKTKGRKVLAGSYQGSYPVQADSTEAGSKAPGNVRK